MPSLRESAKMASVVDAASAEQEENLMMSNLADVNPDRVLVKMFLDGKGQMPPAAEARIIRVEKKFYYDDV